MRAIRFEREGGPRAVQVPDPAPGPDEVLVRVLASGVCRTDLHILDAIAAGRRPPIVPGHEIAGRVAKIGSDVYTVAVGDAVGVHFEQPCGACRHCRRKRTNLCRSGHTLGFDAPGGYAEYVTAKQSTLLVLPPSLEPVLAAPLACSGATAYHAIMTVGRAEEGDVVVVLGAGGVGLSAVQVARAQQARVLAIDVREAARTAARGAGAEASCAPEETDAALRALAGDNGADLVVDFVGSARTLALGKSILGDGGRLVAVAEGEGTDEGIPVTGADLVEGGKALLGSYSSTMADFARAIGLAEAGLLRPVVTRRARLAEASDVLRDLRAGTFVGRAVLEPGPP